MEADSAQTRGESLAPSETRTETARELEKFVIDLLREGVRGAVEHALQRQTDPAKARLWLERRIVRPTVQGFQRATQVKRVSVPPPSVAESPIQEAASKISVRPSRKPPAPTVRPSVPPPSASRPKTQRAEPGALARALQKPDRASVPPGPPPPSTRPSAPPFQRARRSEPPPLPPHASWTPPPPSSRVIEQAPEPQTEREEGASQVSPAQVERKLSALRFLDGPKDQAEFLLDLILHIAPASSALVYSVSRKNQEATVLSASGERAAILAELTVEPQDPLLTQLRRAQRTLRVASPATDERCLSGRWAVLNPKKHVTVVPVSHERRLVGLFELSDSDDGRRFSQEQIEMIEHLGEAWAPLLAER